MRQTVRIPRRADSLRGIESLLGKEATPSNSEGNVVTNEDEHRMVVAAEVISGRRKSDPRPRFEISMDRFSLHFAR
jgi:hypothetical protein